MKKKKLKQSGRLPRRIRIMGQLVKVRRPRKLSMKGNENSLGCMDDAELEIEVASGVSTKASWDGFCHEWAHVVMSVTGLNQRMTEELEEALAQTFGSALREFCEQRGLKLH